MRLTVIVEKASENWGAYAPDLEDSIIATGDTREAAIQNFQDALLDLFDYKRERGQSIPPVMALEIRETRAWTEEQAAALINGPSAVPAPRRPVSSTNESESTSDSQR